MRRVSPLLRGAVPSLPTRNATASSTAVRVKISSCALNSGTAVVVVEVLVVVVVEVELVPVDVVVVELVAVEVVVVVVEVASEITETVPASELDTKTSPLEESYAMPKGLAPTGTVATTVWACADGARRTDGRTKAASRRSATIAGRR